jgi:hypothetical protein
MDVVLRLFVAELNAGGIHATADHSTAKTISSDI